MGYLKELDFDLYAAKKSAEKAVRAAVVGRSLQNGPSDASFDSSLLQVANLRFPDKEIVKNTIDQIQAHLRLGDGASTSSFLYRYLRKDDFGQPQSAFLKFSFWLIQALGKTGQTEKAREVTKNVMVAANALGLFSEHYVTKKNLQTGNFPQAYSHVGQIKAAFAVSPPWDEIL